MLALGHLTNTSFGVNDLWTVSFFIKLGFCTLRGLFKIFEHYDSGIPRHIHFRTGKEFLKASFYCLFPKTTFILCFVLYVFKLMFLKG